MKGIFVTNLPSGRPRCARCGKYFTPKNEGDRFGPRCARLQQKTHLDILDSNNKTVAMII